MDGHEIFNQVSAEIDADIAKQAKAIMRRQVEEVERLEKAVERKTAKLEEARKLLDEMVGMSGKEIVGKYRFDFEAPECSSGIARRLEGGVILIPNWEFDGLDDV